MQIDEISKEAARIVAVSQERGDFVTDTDGFVYYWPKEAGRGHLSAWHLRVLADELDRRNEPWQKEINDYFEQDTPSQLSILK